MHHYRNNQLYIEQTLLQDVADSIKTPFYIYSAKQIVHNYQQYQHSLPEAMICYAVKANSNLTILNLMASLGAGADCVSMGEIIRALKAGISPSKVVFSGVGKTAEELKFALEAEIFQFNIESIPELQLLNQIAGQLAKKANIAIRLNLDVDGGTHHKITTGLKSNKFGIDADQLPAILELIGTLDFVHLQGLSVHIGSQITTLEPYRIAYNKLITIAQYCVQSGFGITFLDLGGGLGVNYGQESPPSVVEYSALIKELFANQPYQIIVEPGRSIVADAGMLITKVLYIKENVDSNFAIVDAGMNDIMRQSLYDAYHDFLPLHLSSRALLKYNIVGPICESSDIFLSNKELPELRSGDVIAILSAGAYGSSMSSTYNSRLLIPEIIVDHDKFITIRTRPNYDQLFALENIGQGIVK